MANEPEVQPGDGGAEGGLSKEVRNWGMLCHLAALAGYPFPLVGYIAGPLVVWLIKREEHPFIDDQGREALNFQITMIIAMVVAAVLIVAFIGIVLLPIVLLFDLIMIIVAAIKASDGERYRYPICIRFVK